MDGINGTGNTLASGCGDVAGSYESTTGAISFYISSDGSTSGDDFVYSVSCSSPPSCLPPTVLTATNLTPTSADLGWTAGGTETVWELTWGVQGTTPGSATSTLVPMVSTNPYTLTGLSANTSYDYYIKADCGFGTGSTDLSTWAGPFSFTTACLAVTTLSEDFSSGLLPSCWSQSQSVGGGWEFSGSAGVGVQDFGTAGTYAWIDMSGGDDADVVLQLPTVDVSNYNQDAMISFEYYSSLAPYTGFPGTPIPNSLFLEFSQDQGSTWTIIGTYDQYVNGWNEVNFILDLANFTAPNTLDLRFRGENNGYSYGFYNDIALDNVSVSELPSCPFSPTGLTASNITATSFDLDWTAAYNETSWVVDYVAPGLSPGLSTGNSILVTTNPATITGLTEKTSYDVYVRAFCAVGDSSDWSLVLPVTTASSAIAGVTCTTTGAISSAIFTEEFDANSAGWTGNINTGNGSWEVPNASTSGGTGADAAHSGTSFMNFEGSDTLNNQGSIYSPEIDLTGALDDVQLSFWMHGYGNTMGTLNVSVVRPGTDTTVVFTSSGQTHASGSMPWWNIGVDLSTYIGETVKLAFTQIDDQDYVLYSSI